MQTAEAQLARGPDYMYDEYRARRSREFAGRTCTVRVVQAMSTSCFSMSCSTSCTQDFFGALQNCSASGGAGGADEWNSPVHAQDKAGHGQTPRVLAAYRGVGTPKRLKASPCSLTSSTARRLLVDMDPGGRILLLFYFVPRESTPGGERGRCERSAT